MPFQISTPPERKNDMSLYENIHNRRKSGKPMRKKGDKGGMINKGYKNGGCVMAGRGVRNTQMV